MLIESTRSFPIEPFELRALADLLARVDPATPAEAWVRQRVLDQRVRLDLAERR